MSDRGDNYIEIEIDGHRRALDVDADTATSLETLDSDMEAIAGQIAWYGRVLGAAVYRRDMADARYRAWRATRARMAIANNPKLAEHHVKNAVEADPAFLQHKEAIASGEELVVRLQKAVSSLEVKAEILRSMGARARSELGAHGMSTRAGPREDPVRDKDRALREQNRDKPPRRIRRRDGDSETTPGSED